MGLASRERVMAVRRVIDVKGASGSSYRFKLHEPEATHLPIAGNYVIIQAGAAVPARIGVSTDLSKTASSLEVPSDHHLYTRLNVGRQAREAEQEDILANHPQLRRPSSR